MFKSLSAIMDQDEKMASAKATTDHPSKILLQIISSNELELDLHLLVRICRLQFSASYFVHLDLFLAFGITFRYLDILTATERPTKTY